MLEQKPVEDSVPEDMKLVKDLYAAIEKVLGRKDLLIFIATKTEDNEKEENIDWWFHTEKFATECFEAARKRLKDRCNWAEAKALKK